MHTTHLLYLHGFRSSPLSAKAKKMATVMRERFPAAVWLCPQLPPSPRMAIKGLMSTVSSWLAEDDFKNMAVVGSSLGGFYATWIAEQMGCKAVLLNPAVEPARDLAAHIGEQSTWQNPNDRFFFREEFINELRELQVGALQAPENYLAVIAKGDEVLDWREMASRYAGSHLRLIEGGDHALSDFDQHLPAILEFLNLRP